MTVAAAVIYLIAAAAAPPVVTGHGYLKSPRARNLVANQDTKWWGQTTSDPEPETCPQCLNRGGVSSRCGMTEDDTGSRNYDTPKNALGGPMEANVQATWTQGQEVVLDVSLTAHHKGHFVFSGCPISPGEIASQECFDKHPLLFTSDEMHGATLDEHYPQRAYLAPANNVGYTSDVISSKAVMEYSFKMKLPKDLHGDLVLIQWYYLTANSCIHPGYREYNWPSGWRTDVMGADECENVSSDGSGVPEQFWNCAEVRILRGGATSRPPGASNRPPTSSTSSSSLSTPLSAPTSSGPHSKTIVGYYASWQWYDRNKLAAPENMDFTKVQRVNFAFFQNDEQGNIWGTDSWADPSLLFGPYNWSPPSGSKEHCSWDGPNDKVCNHHQYDKGLITLVHNAGAEIYPSLGGWTLSDPFPAMSASAPARARFAQNCVDLIKEYGFDGIDIDWEYPGYASHSGTPADTENFKLLLNDVRAKLDELGSETGRFYGLTAALPCGPQHIDNMDIVHVGNTLSELNLMTYDFHGAFSDVTGVNAPLYFQGWGDPDFNLHSCVENWLKSGVDRKKINIGLPFYGRSAGDATGLNQPHSGADKSVWGIDEGTPQYFNIIPQLPSMTSVWDEKTWTQYAYFSGGGFVSFDDEAAICAKTEYCLDHELGGFIIWELSGDLMDDLSTPLLDVVNKKLSDPSYSCGKSGILPEGGVDLPLDEPPAPSASSTSVADQTDASQTTDNSSSSEIENPDESSPSYQFSFDQNDEGHSAPAPTTSSIMNAHESEGPSEFLFCGGDEAFPDNVEVESLKVSFHYEMHRYTSVPLADAASDIKQMVLNSISEKLLCHGSLSGRHRLSEDGQNPFSVSQQNVVAISTSQSDVPVEDVPCSIPVDFEVPTTCTSMIDMFRLHIKKGSSNAVRREVWDELVFYIRTSMSAGRYESDAIRKVIYVDEVGSGPSVQAPPNAHIIYHPQNASKSAMMALVVCLILVTFACTVMLCCIRAKRDSLPHRDMPPSSINLYDQYNFNAAANEWSQSMARYWKENSWHDDEHSVPRPKSMARPWRDNSWRDDEQSVPRPKSMARSWRENSWLEDEQPVPRPNSHRHERGNSWKEDEQHAPRPNALRRAMDPEEEEANLLEPPTFEMLVEMSHRDRDRAPRMS